MDSILAKVKPHLSRCSSLVLNENKDGGTSISGGGIGGISGLNTANKMLPAFLVPTAPQAKNRPIPFTVPLSSSIPPQFVRGDSFGDSAASSSGESTPQTPELRGEFLFALDLF